MEYLKEAAKYADRDHVRLRLTEFGVMVNAASRDGMSEASRTVTWEVIEKSYTNPIIPVIDAMMRAVGNKPRFGDTNA